MSPHITKLAVAVVLTANLLPLLPACAQGGQSDWICPTTSSSKKAGKKIAGIGQSGWLKPEGSSMAAGQPIMLNADGAGSELLTGAVTQVQDAEAADGGMELDPAAQQAQMQQMPMQQAPMHMVQQMPMQQMQQQPMQMFQQIPMQQMQQPTAMMQQMPAQQPPMQQMPVTTHDDSMANVVFGLPGNSEAGAMTANSMTQALSTAAAVGALTNSLRGSVPGGGGFHTYGSAPNGTYYAGGSGPRVTRGVTRTLGRSLDYAMQRGTMRLMQGLMH